MKNIKYFLANIVFSSVLVLPQFLPYRWRIPFAGRAVSKIIAPIAGYRTRIRNNLAHVMPELPEDEVKRMCHAVPDSAARTVMEIFSGDDFLKRIANTPVRGPGIAALDEAHAAGRPIIIVSAHFGNYDAVRAALRLRGHEIGGIYKPPKNPYFHKTYLRRISHIAAPAYPTDRRGMAQLVDHLKSGNTIFILTDQYASLGMEHEMFGKATRTPTSAAKMALKYNALLVPTYGIRQNDGLNFDIVIEEPIQHTDAETMTLALVRSLEARIRSHMGQWFWVHRKWRPQ